MKTNRDYLSYSQLKLWETSQKSFWKRYGLGESPPSTKYQRFGSDFMKDLEYDTFKTMHPDVEVYEHIEAMSDIEYPVANTTVRLMGYIDSISDDFTNIIEYKTGMHPWNQEMVDKDDQTLFYSYIIWLNTEEIPTCKLIWLETELDAEGNVQFTGKVESFTKKKITKAQLNSMGRRIEKAVIEIEEFEYIDAGIDDSLALRLKVTLDKIKELQGEVDVIKDTVALKMLEAGTKYAETDYGNFTASGRTTITYSADLKKKVAILKRAEEEAGVTTEKTSNFIIFKAK